MESNGGSRTSRIVKRTLRILWLSLGTVLMEVVILLWIPLKSPYLDGKLETTQRNLNVAATLFAAAWVGVGIWQLYKRLPFRFLAWGIAALVSGVVFYLSLHG
jgi:hypothetical protein